MATAKSPAKKKPVAATTLNSVASLCGTLSGMCDHIVQLQAQLQDISGRCGLALEFGKDLKSLSADDRLALSELKRMCNLEFENYLATYGIVEGILKRQRPAR